MKLGGKASKVIEQARKIASQWTYMPEEEKLIVDAHLACADAAAKNKPDLLVAFESSGYQSGDTIHAEMKLDRYSEL